MFWPRGRDRGRVVCQMMMMLRRRCRRRSVTLLQRVACFPTAMMLHFVVVALSFCDNN